MIEHPLVSVVIPLYNAELYFKETLNSLENQTYKKIEIIIVDNCSTDHSYHIADEFCRNNDNAILLKTDYNSGGPAHPRNVGVMNAKGKYIAFLDSDDVWDKSKLLVQLEFMVKQEYNFTCTSRLLIDEDSKIFKRRVDKILPEKTGSYSISSLICRNNITTSSVVVKRDLLIPFPFDESRPGACVEDYLLWLNLLNLKECKFCHIKEPLVFYRLFHKSLSQQSGRLLLFSKSMLVSCLFMIENKRTDLLLISLLSHTCRVLYVSVFKQ